MIFRLAPNSRIRVDGIVWTVERRVSTGVQLVGVGDGALKVITHDDLLRKFREGTFEQISPVVDPESTRALNPYNSDFLCIPVQKREEAERRAKYVDALLKELGPPPYSNSQLAGIIPILHRQLGDSELAPHLRSLRRWLAKQSLIGFDGPADLLIQIGNPQGRQGNHSERFDARLEGLITEILDDYVMCPAPAPLKEIYGTLTNRIKNENIVNPDDPIEIPSLRTFYRRADDLDDEQRVESQKGRAAARAKHALVNEAPREHIPLAVVEIDHCYVDCEVVDDDGIKYSRPTLTAAIDRATGSCVGFVLTFEPPSSTCGMLVLRHIILDKSYVKTAFEGKIRHEWPCFGVPSSIVIDNGADFHSAHFKAACQGLGRIQIVYAEPGDPQIRGMIERFFRTLNSGLFHLLPGTTLSRIDRSSDYDPSRAATITLRKLNEVLHKFIVDIHNHRRPKGWKQSRVEKWNAGVEKYPPRLPASLRQLNILSCACETRVLSRRGIEIFSGYYRSPEFAAVRIKAGGDIKVSLRYDPTDLGRLWVQPPDEDRFIEAECVAQRYAAGRTIWQHNRVLDNLGDKARNAREDDLLQSVAELREMFDSDRQRKSKRHRTKRAAARFTERPTTPDELAGAQAAQPDYASMDEAFAQEPEDPLASSYRSSENSDQSPADPSKSSDPPHPGSKNDRGRRKPTEATSVKEARQPAASPKSETADAEDLDAFIRESGMTIRRSH